MVEDGLKRTNFWVGNLYSEGVISGAQFTITGSIVAGDIYNSDGLIQSNSAGSPSTFGVSIQAGEATIGAGSEVWIKYGQAFPSVPASVVACYNDHTLGYVSVGSLTAGSALVIGETASKNINWIAVG